MGAGMLRATPCAALQGPGCSRQSAAVWSVQGRGLHQALRKARTDKRRSRGSAQRILAYKDGASVETARQLKGESDQHGASTSGLGKP
jgi:hypothetical protein